MSARRARALAITLVAAGLLAVHAAYFDHVADDAYIALRYADNALRGHGLVFNPGERVMGYSNFLWVAALVAGGAAGFDLVGLAQALGGLAALAALALVGFELARRHPSPWAPLGGSLWLAASGPFALWSTGGLEGPLFALALAASVIAAQRFAEAQEADESAGPRSARALAGCALAAVVAVWTRPEGIVFALLIAAWVALRTGALRAALVVAGAAALAWCGLAGFAWLYYGDPLPNTARAKWLPLSREVVARGWAFTRHYVVVHEGAPLFIVVAWLAQHARRPRAAGWLPLLLLGAFSLYYLRIGGDALVYYRMWAAVQPLFALLLGDAIGALATRAGSAAAPRRARLARALAASLALALPLLQLPNSLRGYDIDYLRFDDARIRALAELGRVLRTLPPDTRIAANVIGALGYESRLPLVDMLGLTDAHIARSRERAPGVPGHEAHDGAYVLDRAPALVFVGIPRAFDHLPSLQEAFEPAFPSDRDLLDDPRFARDYRFVTIPLPSGGQVPVFRRKDFDALPQAPAGRASPPRQVRPPPPRRSP